VQGAGDGGKGGGDYSYVYCAYEDAEAEEVIMMAMRSFGGVDSVLA
jgi:hypothetical protein